MNITWSWKLVEVLLLHIHSFNWWVTFVNCANPAVCCLVYVYAHSSAQKIRKRRLQSDLSPRLRLYMEHTERRRQQRGISGYVSSFLIAYISPLFRSLCSESTKDVRGLNHLCYSSALARWNTEGVWRRGASLLKGFREPEPVLWRCPPRFVFPCHVSMNRGTFLNPLEVRAAISGGWWKCPCLRCNTTKGGGTKVCAARRGRKSSKRLKIVEQLRHPQSLRLLVARIL